MINEYFEFDDWDIIDTLIVQLYDVRLIKPIGEFDVGSFFKVVVVDHESGVVRLIDEEDNEVEYFINYSLSENQ